MQCTTRKTNSAVLAIEGGTHIYSLRLRLLAPGEDDGGGGGTAAAGAAEAEGAVATCQLNTRHWSLTQADGVTTEQVIRSAKRRGRRTKEHKLTAEFVLCAFRVVGLLCCGSRVSCAALLLRSSDCGYGGVMIVRVYVQVHGSGVVGKFPLLRVGMYNVSACLCTS